MKVFWLSFCDPKRSGDQFVGACLIDVNEQDAATAAIILDRRFPHAMPDAEWPAAATSKARRLGCNPGGEVAIWEIPADHLMLTFYPRGVLLDRATIERIERESCKES